MAKSKALELSIHIAGRVDKSLMASINTTQNQLSNLARNMSQVGTAGIAAMGALATGTVMAISSCTKEAEKFANGMGDVVKYVDGLADKTGKIDTTKYAEMSRAILKMNCKNLLHRQASPGKKWTTCFAMTAMEIFPVS